MKILRTFISIIVLFLIVTSCRKDDINPVEQEVIVDTGETDEDFYMDSTIHQYIGDTTRSSEYIAAYPGSWWTFSNGDELSCDWLDFEVTKLVNVDYNEHIIELTKTSMVGPHIEGSYLPNTFGGIVLGDDMLVNRTFWTGVNRQIDTDRISEVGLSWREEDATYYDTSEGHPIDKEWSRTIIGYYSSHILPNGDVYNDVVHISAKYVENNELGVYEYRKNLFYAKDVGLIKEESFFLGEVVFSRYLVDYYIAPH